MRSFTFFKHDGRCAAPDFDVVCCADLREAEDHAKAMLYASNYPLVEIWDGVQALRVERGREAEADTSRLNGGRAACSQSTLEPKVDAGRSMARRSREPRKLRAAPFRK
jgi:hypothetical protein